MNTKILALAVLLLLAHMAYFYPYTPDDTFISLRYAQRFVAGHGLSWNDGEYVEGYSNPLWVLLAAALNYLGMDLLVSVQLMGATCALMTLFAFAHYARKYAVPVSSLAIGLIVFALSAPVAIWGVAGLETPMVMFLFAWVLVLCREPSNSHVIKIGCLLGLICWLRPEGPLYTIAIAIGLLYIRTPIRTLVWICAIPFAFFSALVACRLSYYGTWFPNTVLVKVVFSQVHVVMGLLYAAKALLSFSPALFLIYYGAKKQVLHPFSRFLLIVGLLLTLAIIAAGGDWLLGYRAFVPLVPVIILLLMENCGSIRDYRFITCIVLAFIAVQFLDKNNLNANMGKPWVAKILRPMGEELGKQYGAKQPLIAVFTAGAIPYYSQLPTLDVYGLNDAYLTSHRHEKENFGHGLVGHDLFDVDYIESRKPDLLLFDIPGIVPQCGIRQEECEKLFTHYEPVTLKIPGHDIEMWQRKSSQ